MRGSVLSKLGNFVWGIADQLRGVYRPHQYGGVILRFTILRRLDCVLETPRDRVRALATQYSGGALDVMGAVANILKGFGLANVA
jgi:type I restriction enzyme M protein